MPFYSITRDNINRFMQHTATYEHIKNTNHSIPKPSSLMIFHGTLTWTCLQTTVYTGIAW